jgi:hypothetical protein
MRLCPRRTIVLANLLKKQNNPPTLPALLQWCGLVTLLSYLLGRSLRFLLLLGNLDTFPQTLNLKLLTGGASVDVLDVVGGGLEVAGGIVALGDEDVVLGTILKRLVDGNGGTLAIVSVCLHISTRITYHELLLNLAKAVETSLELDMVVG